MRKDQTNKQNTDDTQWNPFDFYPPERQTDSYDGRIHQRNMGNRIRIRQKRVYPIHDTHYLCRKDG